MCVRRSPLGLAFGFAALLTTGCSSERPIDAHHSEHGLQHEPGLRDRNLSVRTVVSALTTPTTMAFLGTNDFLVLEKNTGKVKRVVDGSVQGTVLDLAVNSASERGLLGIALHPSFSTDAGVYLFWTESSTGADRAASARALRS